MRFIITLCLAMMTSSVAFSQVLGDVSLPALPEKGDKKNGLVSFSGSVQFEIKEGVSDPAYAALSFKPSGREDVLIFPSVVEGDTVNGPGTYTWNYELKLPPSLNVEYQARVDVSEENAYPAVNYRLVQDRVFYLGNSLTQHGTYIEEAEKLLMVAQNGSDFKVQEATGSAQTNDGQSYNFGEKDGSWLTQEGTKVEFKSYGWSGATAKRYATNFLWTKKLQDFNTTTVIVMLGINDGQHHTYDHTQPLKNIETIASDYREHINLLLRILKSSKYRVILVSPTAVDETKTFSSTNLAGYNQVLERLTQELKDIARERKVRFVDMFHPYKEVMTADLSTRPEDGIHPSDDGHAAMADILSNALHFDQPMAGE